MGDLVNWINVNADKDPILVSAIAHHQLAYIHPFRDGNGRAARLLMNLILMKRGYPIANISREERPQYYENLSFADADLFEPLIQMIYSCSKTLFSEYLRIKHETDQAIEWAEKWGQTAATVINKRQSRELELWQNRMRQIYLEFEKAADLLDEEIENIEIEIYSYSTDFNLEKFQALSIKGSIEHTNFFSIKFTDKIQRREERFMFRFFRNWDKFEHTSKVIPLELNYFDLSNTRYVRMCDVPWHERMRIRELFYSEKEEFTIRFYDSGCKREVETEEINPSRAAQMFFDDVLKNIFGLTI